MEFGILWIAFGAVVGFIAAQKRGYAPFIGVVIGAALGILSPLMLLAAGLTRNTTAKKCPDCAEFVKADALVCKHCGKRLDVQRA